MKPILFLLTMLISIVSFGQTAEVDQTLLDKFRKEVVVKNPKLTPSDLKEIVISDRNTSRKSGVQNIYIKQLYLGIEIYNAISNMNLLKTGEVLTLNSRIETNLATRIKFTEPSISAIKAMKIIASENNYKAKKIKVLEASKGNNQQQTLCVKCIAEEPVPAKLIYYNGNNRQLTLAWIITVDEIKSSDVWTFFVDAQSGEILHKENRTLN